MTDTTTVIDRYALVGHPVSHSHSPTIHRLFARQTAQQMTYELIDATAEEFEVAVRGFKAAGGKGLNITVPHKERALRIASDATPAAEQAGAANTLDFAGGSIIAHNTDGIGLIRDLTVNLGIELAGKDILILGAGGAVRGILGPLYAAKIGRLIVANRTLSRASQLQQEMAEHAVFDVCGFDELDEIPPTDIVINATSAGVKGEAAPFAKSIFTAETFCYDLSYSVKDTPFVLLARASGAGDSAQGWGMLVEQAAESFAIWRGVRPDTAPILQKLQR